MKRVASKYAATNLLAAGLDGVFALIAWLSFYSIRKNFERSDEVFQDYFNDGRLLQGLVIISITWCLCFYLIGSYRNAYFRSQLGSIQEAFVVSLLGSIGLLLIVLPDDVMTGIQSYTWSGMVVCIVHLSAFVIGRLIFHAIRQQLRSTVWPVSLHLIHGERSSLSDPLPAPFKVNWIKDSSRFRYDHAVLQSGVDVNGELFRLLGTSRAHSTWMSPFQGQQFMSWRLKPLLWGSYVNVKHDPMTDWQAQLKRVGDVVVSSILLLALSPFFLVLFLIVKSAGDGPGLFVQERLGYLGEPFMMYKFRTMHVEAESAGPRLTEFQDARITKIGRWLRRWHLDELPQLWNVLRGDMSIVGPRPEREHFARLIMDHEPTYPLLWRLKPGLTSWGQIKYGYAGTMSELIDRFRYDYFYLHHIGPLADIKVIISTIVLLLSGRGR
ncbi:MAG: sugar transferase [Bacteroidota bacterium]